MPDTQSATQMRAELHRFVHDIQIKLRNGFMTNGDAYEATRVYAKALEGRHFHVNDMAGWQIGLVRVSGSKIVPDSDLHKRIDIRLFTEFIPSPYTLAMSIDTTEHSMCTWCSGSGRDEQHRRHQLMRDNDCFRCPLHGDVGGDSKHGNCANCDGAGSVPNPPTTVAPKFEEAGI